MKRRVFCLFVFTFLCSAQIQTITANRLRAHVKFLASDLLEGRGVGARGGDLACGYIAAQLELAGAKPAGENGSYFQEFPLVGVSTRPEAHLSALGHGKKASFHWLADFVGCSQRQRTLDSFDAEAVFVGHGIVAPEFQWDDFKRVDVRGKVLIFLTNEPPSTDERFFAGRALTYYGRWTYKFEEALRKGAVAALIIHTTPTAGYGWNVVCNSWGREQLQNKLQKGQPALAFAGWLSEQAGERLLAIAGKTVDKLEAMANSPQFRPIPLGIRLHGRFSATVRDVQTRNVAGLIPGSDPLLQSEAVIFSAHWDHFGIGQPVNGDRIYNGAVDNATGCAMLMEIARAWASLEQKPRLSALFLAVSAEESGLLGSQYYAAHPLFPLNKTAAAFNFDAFYPFGLTADVLVTGAERTTLWPLVKEAAKRMELKIAPDPRPEQGSYFRSDHFSFAKVGIPSFSIQMGEKFVAKPDGYGRQVFEEYNTRHYHQPSDEYHADWDFSGMIRLARFGFLLGVNTANLERLPAWQEEGEFLGLRVRNRVR